MRQHRLVDPMTLECIRTDRLDTAVDGAFGAHRVSIAKVSRFTNLLVDYPSITKPEAFNATPKHEVEHFIDAPGPPIRNKVRRLSSERLPSLRRSSRTWKFSASSAAPTARGRHLFTRLQRLAAVGDPTGIING